MFSTCHKWTSDRVCRQYFQSSTTHSLLTTDDWAKSYFCIQRVVGGLLIPTSILRTVDWTS